MSTATLEAPGTTTPEREIAFLRMKLTERDHTIAGLMRERARLRDMLANGIATATISNVPAEPAGRQAPPWLRDILRAAAPGGMYVEQIQKASGRGIATVYAALTANRDWLVKKRMGHRMLYTLRGDAP